MVTNDDKYESDNNMEEVEVDEEEQEEEHSLPQRRQHKYTTADLQPERPWKRWFLICLAFLVVIGIMVLLSIFLQKLFNPPEDEDWDNDSANATDDDLVGIGGEVSGESLLLPKTSDFMDDVCARAKISGTAEEKATCESACAPALDCCNPFRGNSTCLEGQVAGCVTYAPCQALDGLNDPAPTDLDRLCSLDALEINRADCEFACQSMECCYKDTDSCVASKFWSCLDYAPCQNLRLPAGSTADESSIVGVAPANLDDECRDGDGMCSRTCREATCCSDSNSACYRNNFISCLTYATCNQQEDSTAQVSVEPANIIVPAAPDNLEDLCLKSKLGDDAGRAACIAACAPATCCVIHGADGCFGNDPLGCFEYQICANLQ